MSERATVDVSKLPDHAFGSRDPMWWGVMMLMAIEATLMALALGSYFYVRGNYLGAWPPTGVGETARGFATGGLVVLVASGAAIVPVQLATRRYALGTVRKWMIAVTLLSLASLVLRALELHALPFRWSAGAYGSVVWTTLGFHTLHLAAGVIENVLLTVLTFTRRLESKHYVDLDLNGLFWLFVVVEWVVTYAVIYGEGLLAG
jgi:cytochrome c oxidase subunit I+III